MRFTPENRYNNNSRCAGTLHLFRVRSQIDMPAWKRKLKWRVESLAGTFGTSGDGSCVCGQECFEFQISNYKLQIATCPSGLAQSSYIPAQQPTDPGELRRPHPLAELR